MTTSGSRLQSRRQEERRVKERRAVDYQFGSPEWLAWVQQENFLWPKQDRRRHDRRIQDRRQHARRASNKGRTTRALKTHNLLSEEEKHMLAELMRQYHAD